VRDGARSRLVCSPAHAVYAARRASASVETTGEVDPIDIFGETERDPQTLMHRQRIRPASDSSVMLQKSRHARSAARCAGVPAAIHSSSEDRILGAVRKYGDVAGPIQSGEIVGVEEAVDVMTAGAPVSRINAARRSQSRLAVEQVLGGP
jgi:hypothetical protein